MIYVIYLILRDITCCNPKCYTTGTGVNPTRIYCVSLHTVSVHLSGEYTHDKCICKVNITSKNKSTHLGFVINCTCVTGNNLRYAFVACIIV
jgi:hypothetical protein